MINLNDNLHDVNAPIIGKNPCRECGEKLIVGENWYESCYKDNSYICIDCSKKYNKQWRLENREKKKEQNKRWYETPIGKFRKIASYANKNCTTKTTYKHLICLFVLANGICPYTNRKLSFNDMHLEHIKSKSNNGDNNYDNLVFVSDVYNMGKNGYTTEEYIEKMGDLINREQMEIAAKEIKQIHNRYEFEIDRFLEMTDDELASAVEAILNLTNTDKVKVT